MMVERWESDCFVVGKSHSRLVESSLQGAPVYVVAAFVRAAMIGETSAVARLLACGLDVNVADENGRTALLEAAFGGHVETVRTLLAKDADVNACDSDGWTPLMEAASKGHTEIVKDLLAQGANPKARTKTGCTVWQAAAKSHAEIGRLLADAGAKG